MNTRKLLQILTVTAGLLVAPGSFAGNGAVTLIHTGDFHGHLIPRPNLRSDAAGHSTEGGLARIATRIKELRAEHPDALLIHTGDTIQGSAEVLYTRGQAIVDIVNTFGIDAFAPGNWEFVYGTQRFLELFGPVNPVAPWNSIAANLYYDPNNNGVRDPGEDQRVLPPYLIRQVGAVKIGILGLTTDRGPQVVGRAVTRGFYFLKNGAEVDAEVAAQVKHLREVERVDLLVVASEMGLANNIRIAEAIPGIDVVLSSDMHEETTSPVVTRHGTLVIEEGQDGTMLGKLRLLVQDGRVKSWNFNAYRITDDNPEDAAVAAMVTEARKSFVSGPDFVAHINPFNGSKLVRPIDTVVGATAIPLHRSNFSHEPMPAVIEGSSHDFLTDAYRHMTGADIGAIRGFRYGTHVPVGPIRYEDLFHFLPIGPQIARGNITGTQLKNQIEGAADGSLNPDVAKWTGGWLFNFSNVAMDIDPYQTAGNRASNIRVAGAALDPAATYSYASYWYAADPGLINVLPAANICVLKDVDGATDCVPVGTALGTPIDATEVVARYLETLPERTANPALHRIRLLQPLPAPRYFFPEVQPLWGAQP